MRLTRQLVVLTATASLALTAAPVTAAPRGAAERTEVGTYNLFLGGDIGTLLTGIDSPDDFVAAADALWREVVASDFPSRAEAIADLLAEEQPDVVGLQEVARWKSVSLTTETPGGYDFLAILLAELAERGTPYEVVVKKRNFDSSVIPFPSPVPGFIPLPASGVAVQYVDRDVIIARADLPADELKVLATAKGAFHTNVAVPFPGGEDTKLTVPRGWTSADLLLHGKKVRFVNTHLEAFGAGCREAQARELAALLAGSPYPVVLVGDLNDDPRAGAVAILQKALGLSDAWRGRSPRGYTAGQDDLTAAQPQFDRRIDYVLYEVDRRPRLHATRAEVIGEEVDDRSDNGLWPSDHAGVLATLHLTPRSSR